MFLAIRASCSLAVRAVVVVVVVAVVVVLIRPYSTLFDLIRPCSTLIDLIRPCSTLLDLLRPYSTLFDPIQVPIKPKKGPGRRHLNIGSPCIHNIGQPVLCTIMLIFRRAGKLRCQNKNGFARTLHSVSTAFSLLRVTSLRGKINLDGALANVLA